MRLKGLLAAPLIFVIACKQPTAAEQLDSVLSWLATAGMAGDAWLHHTTPDRYTRQTLELSQHSLQQLATDLKKSAAPGIDKALVDTVLSRSLARVAQMIRLVEARNFSAFASDLDSLHADESIIKQLTDDAWSSR
jgi:hypothetical protein